MPGVNDRVAWEEEAENWVRWARAPGHDAYWFYRDTFFDRLVPPPGRLTLEVGCGEGRVSRDLAARHHHVVAIDGSPTLVRHARRSDPLGRYVLADASALPFADRSIDMAIAYNSLMDLDDMPGAIREVARVLEPGAALCVCIVHPMVDAGGFEDDSDDARFVLSRSYLSGRQRFEETAERDGLTMRFRGWSHSLEGYFSALAGAGFVVDALREPEPDTGADRYGQWRRFPLFLHLRALRR